MNETNKVLRLQAQSKQIQKTTMKRKIIFRMTNLALGCIAVLSESLAQNYKAETPVPLTPNAASIARYGDVPIGLYTGQPKISFPIYEINTGKIRLPIELVYNYNGLRLEDYPGWVGTGWTLNATGVISRQKRGLRDEDDRGFNGPNKIGKQVASFIDSGLDPFTINNFSSLYPGFYTLLKNVRDGLYDGEPDMFTFSYPGNSGRFYFDDLQCDSPVLPNSITIKEAIVVPYQDIKIKGYFLQSSVGNTAYGEISKFEVIDARGNTYTFIIKEKSSSAPTQNVDDGQPDNDFFNTWYLESVVDPNGVTVNFAYEEQRIALPPAYSEIFIAPTPSNDVPVRFFQVDTQESVLTGITFQGGSISFTPEDVFRLDWNQSEWSDFQSTNHYGLTRPRALSKIQVTRGMDVVKDFTFRYSYFGDNARLRLDSFEEGSEAGSKLIHEFTYVNGVFPKIGKRENIFSQDHWGYYNNISGNTLLPPINETFPANPSLKSHIRPGNERKVNPGAASLGLLVSIKYPTEGLTMLEYEPNTYYTNASNNIAGGLRIKKLTTCPDDGTAPCSIKNYSYTDPANSTQSSGRLTSQIIYSYSFTIAGSLRATTYFSSSQVPVVNAAGNVVEYQYVTVSESNGSSDNGKTVYQFTAQHDEPDENSARSPYSSFAYPFPPDVSMDYRRGFELSKKIYVANSTTHTLREQNASQTSKNYFSSTASKALTFGSTLEWNSESEFISSSNDAMKTHRFIPYSIKSNSAHIAGKSDLTRDASGTVLTVSQTFQYANSTHRLPTKIEKTESNNEKTTSNFLYKADVASISGLTQDEINNITSCPDKTVAIEETTSKNGTTVAGRRYIYNNFANLLKVKEYETGTGYVDRVFYTKYASNGNILEYVNGQGETHSFRYSYGNTLPVAAIVNSKHDNFFYDGFEESSGGTLIENARTGKWALLSNGYTFPSGYQPEDQTNTKMSYWYWDSANSTWIYSGEISFARTFTVPGSRIDDVRAFPSGSLLTSYTYRPIAGMTSITDGNAITSTFEYDNLNRLKIERRNATIVNQFKYKYRSRTSNVVGFSSNYVSNTQTDQAMNFSTTNAALLGSKYTWNFGNGTVKENGSASENQVYTNPGDYVVSLVTTHPEYPTAVTAKQITILPSVSISRTNGSTTVCLQSASSVTVSFAANVSGGLYNYLWEYSTNGPWIATGTNSSILNFSYRSEHTPLTSFRCRISDAYGNMRYSSSFTVHHSCPGGGGGGNCDPGCTWDPATSQCDCGGGGGGCPEGCFWNGSECVCP
jgi:hypothetical protein